MKFQQYYLECLSHASYLIGDETTGRAVVIDPQRDIAAYLADAEAAGLSIELVIETHFHADFLSGHLELAEATGAKIVYSSVAQPEFDVMGVADGERYTLGPDGSDAVTLEFRHTPGHTPESMSIVVYEHAGDIDAGRVPFGVFTGDTLFIGDVGRPDLLASIGFTREELADMLYDSLHDQLMTLPDATTVYPAHGAGSACGKNLSTELSSTIGEQKATNYALRAPGQGDVHGARHRRSTAGTGYFVYDAILNRKERELLDEQAVPEALTYEQVRELVAGGAMLVDGRDPEEFALGHLVGKPSTSASRAATPSTPARSSRPTSTSCLVTRARSSRPRPVSPGSASTGSSATSPTRMRTMFQHRDDAQIASRLTARAFDERRDELDDIQIVDVRNPGEVAEGTIPGAIEIPVGQLPNRSTSSTSQDPPSSTAPAATARRSPRRCSARRASST
jgi:hydroxyacylglutathione hydrolase